MNAIEWTVIALLTHLTRVAWSASIDECLAIGFRSTDLLCSRCDELIKFDLSELRDTCAQCCRDASQPSSKKYSSARIEVCNCNIGHFPQVAAFIKGDLIKKYPKVSVKYIPSVLPTIKLLDAKNVVREELNIQKWDTNTIEEFLNEHIM